MSISNSNYCSTDEDGNELVLVSEDNLSNNKLVCKIKCYCGILTTVYKLSSQRHKKKDEFSVTITVTFQVIYRKN